jgi:hypothetical protein
MSVFNRRNAFLGWLSWVVAKRLLKQKVRSSVPGTAEGSRRPNRAAFLAGLAAVGAAVFFWRKRVEEQQDETGPPTSGE